MLPLFPDYTTPHGKRVLLEGDSAFESLSLPLNILTTHRSEQRSGKTLHTHLWTNTLPSEAFQEDDYLGVSVASPLFTLLTMAPNVSVTHLAMAAFELCGSFAVFKPSNEIQPALDRLHKQRLTWPGNWRQVRDHNGKPTSLWQRDPLIELPELHAFLNQTAGMRGHKKLAQAARMITGIAASPLEAQASILLGASRRMGGEGLGPFGNNERIRLTVQARKLAGQTTCYADIFFPADDRHGDIDIECHGHMIHDGGAQGGLDANRALALQSMNVEVILLTAEQLTDPLRFRVFADHLAALLRTRRGRRTEAMDRAQDRLRRELFIDWETLGA